MSNTIYPNSRVMVFDNSIYKNDVDTPLSFTVRPATVVCRYGRKEKYPSDENPRIYPDLIDVIFDHRPEVVSSGHFADNVELA